MRVLVSAASGRTAMPSPAYDASFHLELGLLALMPLLRADARGIGAERSRPLAAATPCVLT